MQDPIRRALLLPAAAIVVAVAASARPAFADLAVGDPAPDFTLKDQDGNDVKLSSFAGKKAVVLAFFPKAFTPGCTKEMTCMASEFRKIDERGAVILGISVDPVARQKEFATTLGAKFPMLSDESRTVTKAYGALVQSAEGGYSARSTFVIGKDGKIAWMEREFAVPKTLEGTALLAALDKIANPGGDPAAALEKLASPEKEARTLAVRFAQAWLREDLPGLQSMFHMDYGWRATEASSQWKTRREADVARIRKTFDQFDLRTLAFTALFDPKAGRLLAKGDVSKPGGSGGLSDAALKVAANLADGDLFLVIPTKNPKLPDAKGVETEVFGKELALVLRNDGAGWKVLEVVR